MKYLSFALMIFSAFSVAEAKASPSSCSLTINREPCPGKETEAWYPYNGVNPTSQNLQARDQAMCLKMAQRSATIARKGVLKKVTVTGTFNGSAFSPVVSQVSCSIELKEDEASPSHHAKSRRNK